MNYIFIWRKCVNVVLKCISQCYITSLNHYCNHKLVNRNINTVPKYYYLVLVKLNFFGAVAHVATLVGLQQRLTLLPMLSWLMLLSLLPRGFLPPERFIAWEHVAHLLSGSCGMVTPSTRGPLSRSVLAGDHIGLGVPNSVDNRGFRVPRCWFGSLARWPAAEWSAEHTCSPLIVVFIRIRQLVVAVNDNSSSAVSM